MDMGTGTGAFLSELSKEYPQAILRGYDISDDLFPPPGDLAPNIELGIMDIKKQPPPEERGRYDVVHARLLVAAMDAEDWDIAVSNLMQLLKPGGALQWEECSFGDARYYRGEVGSTFSGVKAVQEAMQRGLQEKLAHGWNTLPQIMRKAGLINVEQDVVSSDRVPETREVVTRNAIEVTFGWAKIASERGIPGSIPTYKLAKLEEQAFNDLKSGCYARYDIHVALGFKPE